MNRCLTELKGTNLAAHDSASAREQPERLPIEFNGPSPWPKNFSKTYARSARALGRGDPYTLRSLNTLVYGLRYVRRGISVRWAVSYLAPRAKIITWKDIG
jgi:hypothetical protein